MSQIVSDWLDYAHSAVSPTDHFEACRTSTGGASTAGLEPDLRWPGYLGSGYEESPFRLLFLGQIHYPEELARTLGSFQQDMRTWASQPRTPSLDQRFLGSLQAAYRKAIPQWGPWKRTFSKLANRQRLAIEQIAYGNVAKCWLTVKRESNPNTTKPMRACMPAFSPRDLVRRVRAQAAVVLCGRTFPLEDLGIPHVTLIMRHSNPDLEEAHRVLTMIRRGQIIHGRIAIGR